MKSFGFYGYPHRLKLAGAGGFGSSAVTGSGQNGSPGDLRGQKAAAFEGPEMAPWCTAARFTTAVHSASGGLAMELMHGMGGVSATKVPDKSAVLIDRRAANSGHSADA